MSPEVGLPVLWLGLPVERNGDQACEPEVNTERGRKHILQFVYKMAGKVYILTVLHSN
jgi:hypothetical protein